MTKNKNSNSLQNNSSSKKPPQKVIQTGFTQFTSPLPPAEILDQYEQSMPGLRERIIKMIEATGDHRRKLEVENLELQKKHLQGQVDHQKSRDGEAKRGQLFAFLISMTAMIIGGFLIYQNHPWPGSVLGLGGLAPVVRYFVHGSKKENK